jgi:hypothetical protein
MRFNNLFEFPLAYDHPSDAVLTQRFHFQLPSQIPESFTISPLPDEISSLVCQVLQLAASSLTASKKRHLKTSTGAGDAGRASLPEPGIEPTPSSLPYPQPTPSSSHAHFSPAFGISSGVQTERFDSLTGRQYLAALSAKPQATWLRRFGTISNGAAISLFLMDHRPHKIMILGRWSSEAFLVYIRPQVLKWTNNMSHDMIRFDSFTDITRTSDTAGNASWLAPPAFNGSGSILVPKLHLLH